MQCLRFGLIRLILIPVLMGLVRPSAFSQPLSPIDGESLNYRQILFEVPGVSNATSYVFSFQLCNFRAEQCKTIFETKSKHRGVILTDPFEFGKTYRWSYKALKGSKVLYQSREFTFQIAQSPLVDSLVQKIVFVKPNTKPMSGILLVDGLKLALDCKGKPVLFLNYSYDHSIRDINLSPQGTLTLVDNRLGEVKEIRLNGEMVWIGDTRAENGPGRNDKFHHEFEKLSTGNYLAATKKRVGDFDESAGLQGVPENTLCESIVEMNESGEQVWRFDLLPELKRQFGIAPTSELFNPTRLGHLNGILADEPGGIVYASFKTFNTVFKIEKSTNRILYQYGLKRINFKDSLEPGLKFEQQHAPIFSRNGNILLFNNGNQETGSGITELLVSDQLDSNNEVLNQIYFKDYFSKDTYAGQMGSVQETGKGRYLVCMGSMPHFFEIDARKKKLLWQAYTFQNTRWEEGGKIWKPLFSYRINYYSSLYPYHFLVDKIGKPGTRKQKIRVVNTGTEADSYILLQLDESGQVRLELKQVFLQPGKSAKLELPNGYSRFEVKSIRSKFTKSVHF